MKDLEIHLEDKPGTLAKVAEALGNAGINIEGGTGLPCEGKGQLHLLFSESDEAKGALESAGISVIKERDVVVRDIEDRPGALAEVTRKLADASVNVNLMYLASKTRLVLGVDNLEKAKSLL